MTEQSAVVAAYADRSSDYGDPAEPLANHLPMAVRALLAMGASQARAAAWARGYAERAALSPATPVERVGRRRWRAAIARAGAVPTYREAAHQLAAGIGAAAFHAVIRAAYALDAADDDDLAAALETWERERLDLPAPPTTGTVPLAAALAALAAAPIAVAARGLIADRMRAVAAHPAFAALAGGVPPPDQLDELARAAAVAFGASGDFTALHVMTGTHALLVARRHGIDPAPLMPAVWRAYAAAALVAGARPTLEPATVEALRAEPAPPWAELHRRAVAHDDDHVIKSVYTAWQLDLMASDQLYRTAAHRYLARRGG